jgi:type IV pilus assembly protein PilC
MAVYKFRGKNPAGNIVTGERTGRTSKEVTAALERDQIMVINIEKKRVELQIPFLSKGKVKRKVSLRDLSVFNRQLAVMFSAGLPVTQALMILATQQKNRYFQDALLEIRKEVEGGATLSNALKKYPDIFNELYSSMIQAGEASGNLDTILMRLSEYTENMARLVGKVKSAMAYPIVVLIIAVVITAVIMIKVVPIFEDMFDQLGASLPVPTKVLIDVSHFMQSNFFIILGALVGVFFALRAYNKTYKGRRIFDKIKLKMPIFGTLLLKVAVARVTRTLETLLNSGVEIIESMTITAKTAGNAIIEDTVLRSRHSVQEGKPLGQSWEEEKVFPFMVTQMVNVGEQTGALSNMLGKIADFYDEEVNLAVDALVAMMEPILILFLGGIVGGVIIAMYMPMFDIIGKL